MAGGLAKSRSLIVLWLTHNAISALPAARELVQKAIDASPTLKYVYLEER